MAKKVDDTVLDAALNEIATSVNQTVCSAEPTNYADITNVDLGTVVLTAGAGGGDYTIANGDTSGRKLTVGAQNSVSVTTTGTATHIAYDNGSVLKFVTTCTSQALTSGNTYNVPAHDLSEIADPT